MTTMRFFVIGSWTEGMVHYRKLLPFLVRSENAQIKAEAYRLASGFPVLVETEDSELGCIIHGQLLEIKNDPTLLALLDTFHGVCLLDQQKSVHQRKVVNVSTSNDINIEAYVYYFNRKKLNHKIEKIQNGVWFEDLKLNPPLADTLTERQKSYVLKLGAAKARDIVPINDLSLYRELMKLELIVDKGRRLALSSLGKEVYKDLI